MEQNTASVYALRGTVATFFLWLSTKFGVLVPVMGILALAMALDFLTGWTASILSGEPITSARGAKGILKKVQCIVGVLCGLIADWLVLSLSGVFGWEFHFSPIFGLLVAVWLILNELVSILENIGRSGVKMPSFLLGLIRLLKIKVEDKGKVQEGENE